MGDDIVDDSDDFEIVDGDAAENKPVARINKQPSVDINRDFPVLTDKDGWEIPNFAVLEKESGVEGLSESPRDYAEKALEARNIVPLQIQKEAPLWGVQERKSSPNKRKSPSTKPLDQLHPDYVEGDSAPTDWSLRKEVHSQKRGQKKFAKRLDARFGKPSTDGGEGDSDPGLPDDNVEMTPAESYSL